VLVSLCSLVEAKRGRRLSVPKGFCSWGLLGAVKGPSLRTPQSLAVIPVGVSLY